MKQAELNERHSKSQVGAQSLVASIQNICSDTAHQLADIQFVISTCLKETNLIPEFQSPPWSPTTLSYGYPALICCFSEMNYFFPDQKWDIASYQCIEKMVAEIKTKGVANNSLFSGYAGICFALDMASQEDHLYPRLRKQLHAHLLERIQTNELKLIQQAIKASQPVFPRLYDAVSGIVGILAYLLNHVGDKETLTHVLQMLQAIVALTEVIEINGYAVPGWFIASQDILSSRGDMSHILGSFDTGLAHGISGCLAILAKATLLGVSVPGQNEAMQRIICWLQAHRTDIGTFKDVWPAYVHLQEQKEDVPQASYRDGWCYGAPGIAFSLFLAGCALKDTIIYDYAVNTMESVCKRFTIQNTLSCPSICHGLAGLLAIVRQMYLATKSEVFLNTSTQISKCIFEKYTKDSPFRFKTDFTYHNKQLFIDNPGFMDGAVGIILSLLFQLSEHPRPWLPIFLIG